MDRIAARFREGESFLISSHVRIDGDGLASALAVESLLRALGKKTLVVIPGPVPQVFQFLPGADRVVSLTFTPEAALPADLDTFVILDCADAVRLGALRERLPKGLFAVSIDHHKSGDVAADLDFSDSAASSTGELVHRLLVRGGFQISRDTAMLLYAAIMSDTQRFSLPNTTACSLRAAADLVDRGADAGMLGDRIYRSHPAGELKLWADVIGRLKLTADGRVAWTHLTDEMLHRHGVNADDTQDLSDIARMMAGVEVGVLFRERPNNLGIRVSLRSNHIPILAVAKKFGGGGHELACGCELPGTLEAVEPTVLAAVEEVVRAHDAKG